MLSRQQLLRPVLLVVVFLTASANSAPQTTQPSADPIVRTHEQLIQALELDRLKENPINLLSADGKARFINSLKFCNGGLSSFDYAVLKDELSNDQILATLSLFGQEAAFSKIPGLENVALLNYSYSTPRMIKASSADTTGYSWIPDYRCQTNGICYPSPGRMCNSLSCGTPPAI
jgi:hypothetical protein